MKKKPRPHKLEYESEMAFRNFLLPTGWTVRKIDQDYGEDLEVEIVEGEEVTNKTVRVQLKGTDKDFPVDKPIPFQMETDDLVFLEGCQVPALIILWVQPQDCLYCLFVQEYLREELSTTNPGWRRKKKPTIKFPPDSKLETPDVLSDIATAGYLYVIANKLGMDPQSKGAHYFLNGIPYSDNKTLKERTLKAFTLMDQDKYALAIDEFEDILKTTTLSPTEQISILINQGNAYLRLSRNDDAFDNFNKVLKLTEKVSQMDALEGKSIALGNIGLIYHAKGELDEALKHHKDALKIDREIGYRQGEAADLGNIGLIYHVKGELDKALKHHRNALDIDREIGYRQGEATDFGNIGLIYYSKDKLDEALKYYKDALDIDREIGCRQGEAADLGNIGLICSDKGDLDDALKYHQDALEIHREIGSRQGEAIGLGNIGLIYSAKGELDEALKHHMDALEIHREIGSRQGEANGLGNIGQIYRAKGDLDDALKYLRRALKILDEHSLVYGRDTVKNAIKEIESNR